MSDGYLCVIPESSSINCCDPVGLIFYVLGSAIKILQGTEPIDFQEEFSSYWGRCVDEARSCILLDSPQTLSSQFSVVFCKNIICISSSIDIKAYSVKYKTRFCLAVARNKWWLCAWWCQVHRSWFIFV